jgi:NAD(P)-dependent dehydrogenase (short-subunit alcohol dehydrogenase family)
MTRHFEGKTALITGGSRGIGLAIARALASEGCSLILAGRSQPSLTKAAGELAEYGVPILPMTCDVRIPMAVDSLFAVVRGHVKHLDILINNAGVAHPKLTIDQLPYVTWKEVIETNLGGTFLVTQAALPLMREESTIVNNLSAAAKHVYTGSAAYVASKHGALGFTNTLREELRPRKIRVIALLPGATDTEIWETFWPDAPRKRMMTPEAVAQSVVEALKLPPESTVEELAMMPTGGPL